MYSHSLARLIKSLSRFLLAALLLVVTTGCDSVGRWVVALRSVYTEHSVAKEHPAPAVAAASDSTVSEAPWTRPILYRVTMKAKPFYVFGTIHVPDYRLDTFPPELEAAFVESDAVLTELPVDDAAQSAAATAVRLPPGKRLSTMLPPPVLQSVAETFAAEGVPFAALETMKPWAVSFQLAMLDRKFTFAFKKPLDAVIYQRAVRSGKQAGGIESLNEQLAIFDSLKEREQVELLADAINFRERMKAAKRDPLGEMLDVYVSGNEEQLLLLAQEENDPNDRLSAKLMKRVLGDRNKIMTERILTLVKGVPSRTHFFAVGAGHVIGDDGIVARLEKRGFKSERVVP